MKKYLYPSLLLLAMIISVVYGAIGLILISIVFAIVVILKLAHDEHKDQKKWTARKVHIVTNRKGENGLFLDEDPTVIERAKNIQSKIDKVWQKQKIKDGAKTGKPWVKAIIKGEGDFFGESDEMYQERIEELRRIENIKYQKTIKENDPETFYKEVHRQTVFDWDLIDCSK